VTSVENATTNAHPRTGTDAGNVAAARAALDVMVTDVAVSQGRPSRFLDPVAARECCRRAGERYTQLLGGDTRLVLSASGDIHALINPTDPGNRSRYQVADEYPAGPDDWGAGLVARRGSWWPDYIAWVSTRSGALKPGLTTLGNCQHSAQAKAPGSFVHAV
jgi:hypothetical protein